jgi:hypothetical protein
MAHVHEAHYQAMALGLAALDRAVDRNAPGPADARVKAIRAAAQSMQQLLATHQLLTEEADGTIHRATAEKPALLAESERLMDQHADMLRRAYELDREAELQLAFDEFDVELLRLEAIVMRDMLRAHLRRANTMMYEAYVQVEGGEGG